MSTIAGSPQLGAFAPDRLRQIQEHSMSKPKRKRPSKGPFVAMPKAIMVTPAWRAMSFEGRLLWIELRGWLRNDGLNNGKVLRSCRAAAASTGLSKHTVARGFLELHHYGFVPHTAPGCR